MADPQVTPTLREDLTRLNKAAPSSVSNISLNERDNSVTFTVDNATGGADYVVKIKGLTGVNGGATMEVSQGGKSLTKGPQNLEFEGRDTFPAAVGQVLDSTIGTVSSGKRQQMLNFTNRVHDTLDIKERNNLPLSKFSALDTSGLRGLV